MNGENSLGDPLQVGAYKRGSSATHLAEMSRLSTHRPRPLHFFWLQTSVRCLTDSK